MQYFYKDQYEACLCEDFSTIVACFPQLRFFQPSPDKAPWHVQALIDVDGSEPIELNFWPHKMKGQRRPNRAVEGFGAIFDLIEEALAEAAAEDGDFDVIED